MCFDVRTTMACGHHIISNICDPRKAHNPSCEGQRERFFHDTCAGCDPEHRRRVLKTHYEERHNLLMALFMRAKNEDDHESMAAIEALMIKAVQDVARQNYEISLTRRGTEVLWPQIEGANED